MRSRRVNLTRRSMETPKSQATFQCPRYRTNALFTQKKCTPTHNSIETKALINKPTSITALLSTTNVKDRFNNYLVSRLESEPQSILVQLNCILWYHDFKQTRKRATRFEAKLWVNPMNVYSDAQSFRKLIKDNEFETSRHD